MNILEGYVVCNDNTKEILLNESIDGFKDYTFLNEDTLIKKILGECKKTTLLYLMKEYSLSYELAMEYIKYMPYIEDKTYNNLKIDSIVSAKRALIKEGLYEIDELFKVRLKRTPLTIIDFNDKVILNSLLIKLRALTDVYLYDYNYKEYKHSALLYKDAYDESLDVINKIYNLYNDGISLNNIYILNMDDEYEFILKRLSIEYNIPIAFNKERNILSFDIARNLLRLMEEKDSFDEIINLLDKDDDYFKPILDLIIKYELKDENPILYIDFFKKLLKNMPIDNDNYSDMVKTSLKDNYSDSDYVFYLGCNLGATPKIYKDDEYLNDSELSLINLPTSIIKNKRSKEDLLKLFKYTKNLYISLKEVSGKDSLLPANILNEANIDINKAKPGLGYNRIEDRIKLGIAYTKYIKYKVVDDNLRINDDIKYNQYDNKFKGIDKEFLDKKYIEKPLELAYSNLKTYYACPFSYYLDKVLYLNDYKSTLATRLGSYAHKVLEESYNDDFDFNKISTDAMLEFRDDDEEFKDYFYMGQMKIVLSELIEFNQEFEGVNKLDKVLREVEIKYLGSNYIFKGVIDKLLYTEINGEIYAAIIDYKSGMDKPSLDNVSDGFNLQLPCYSFLLSNYKEFKDKKINIIGIYLQKVNIIALDNTLDIVAQRRNSFKLQGFSTYDLGNLLMLDPYAHSSSYIQSMKIKADSSFYKNAKVIKRNQMEELIDLTKDLIDKAAKNIQNGEFPIEPKKIDKYDKSCTYCKYKDICFKKYEDYKILKLNSFLKEEEE